jgi:hypothetical protein
MSNLELEAEKGHNTQNEPAFEERENPLRAHRFMKFKEGWLNKESSEYKSYLAISKKSKTKGKYVFCRVCAIDILVDSLTKHASSTKHKKNEKNAEKNLPVIQQRIDDTSDTIKLTRKKLFELRFIAFLLYTNKPFLFAPDLMKIMENYHIPRNAAMGRQKASKIANLVFLPFFFNDVIENLQNNPFSLYADEFTSSIEGNHYLALLVKTLIN